MGLLKNPHCGYCYTLRCYCCSVVVDLFRCGSFLTCGGGHGLFFPPYFIVVGGWTSGVVIIVVVFLVGVSSTGERGGALSTLANTSRAASSSVYLISWCCPFRSVLFFPSSLFFLSGCLGFFCLSSFLL